MPSRSTYGPASPFVLGLRLAWSDSTHRCVLCVRSPKLAENANDKFEYRFERMQQGKASVPKWRLKLLWPRESCKWDEREFKVRLAQ